MRVTSDRVAGVVTLSHQLEARNNRTHLAQDGGAARFYPIHRFQPNRRLTRVVVARRVCVCTARSLDVFRLLFERYNL